ncbi:hypothetical protein GGR57DRAFT_510229 [Xylariaceae sp. FL1272]|nr:hypothetical protein GGR57DRAFT_510229 [Xylariaceae sp. FL1272]
MTKCGDQGWPIVTNGMCCSDAAHPIVLAGGTTVLCCPQEDCTEIEPINCDINLQVLNPHPEDDEDPPNIQTTFTSEALVNCGGGCCPWGYSCKTNKVNGQQVTDCVMKADQDHQPDGKPAISSASSTTSSTDSHKTTTTASSSTSQESSTSTTLETTTTEAPDSPSSFQTSDLSSTLSVTDTTVVITPTNTPVETSVGGGNGTASPPHAEPLSTSTLAGVAVAGVAILILLGALVFYLWRRNQSKGRDSPNGNNNDYNSIAGVGRDERFGIGLATIPEIEREKVSELPVVNRPSELGNTQFTRPPRANHYELA